MAIEDAPEYQALAKRYLRLSKTSLRKKLERLKSVREGPKKIQTRIKGSIYPRSASITRGIRSVYLELPPLLSDLRSLYPIYRSSALRGWMRSRRLRHRKAR